jgi:nicotinate-nucleotide--dimethylbenzimidazole phosphoribosyltransferase
VAGAALAHKVAVVDEAAKLHFAEKREPLDVLARVGGFELAAIAGAVMAARLARTPVLLDGFACTAAASVLHAMDAQALDHCLVAHRSAEPAHRRLLDRIGKTPLLDLGMRLGEASGAALAIGLVKAALACHNGMATFSSAGVDAKA